MEPKTDERLNEVLGQLEEGILNLFDSETYKNYLDVMSRFYHYSFRNSLLISLQKPEATYVASYNAWKKNFERTVKKGEKGIRILAPNTHTIKIWVDKTDKQGNVIRNQDGTPIKEQKEQTVINFKVVSVFDITQTEGKELPKLTTPLTGEVSQYDTIIKALQEASPALIRFKYLPESTHGYYNLETKEITIKSGMSQPQTIKTLLHEMSHAILHDREPGTELPEKKNRNTREVEAESVAYVVCNHYGLDTSDYSFGYIAGWSEDKNLKEFKQSMNTIRKASCSLIHSIDDKLMLYSIMEKKEAPLEEKTVHEKKSYKSIRRQRTWTH